MTWALAVAYVVAGALAIAGISLRADPRVTARLSGPADPHGRGGIAALGRLIHVPRARSQLSERLVAAGLPDAELDRLVGQKVLLAAVGAAASLAAAPGGTAMAASTACLLAAAGFRFPDFRLARRVAARRAAISSGVPDLLDLVAVSVTAGLTPRLALDRATDSLRGPLAAELAAARRDVALGASWRSVLRSVATATGLRDLRRLASTLERSARLGTPVAERLRELAREVRAERRAAGEERARRAPVVMLFPLVFLILPAFVLAAVVPAVLVATRGL